MTFAVAVRATKTDDGFVLSVNFTCYFTFFCLGCCFEKDSRNSCSTIIEEIVDVPELAFLCPEMSGYSFFEINLRGANVSVRAFSEMSRA